ASVWPGSAHRRDHKERREVADLRLICRFFVFFVLFVVECVLHLELLRQFGLAAPTVEITKNAEKLLICV
ncbi:MAG: hypothetical protein WAV74_14905, partial [Anaerolineae bacterium]